MAVSLLVVVGVSWDRGEDAGGTVTALPPDFTTAAHPAGSGTGTAALPGAPGAGDAPLPGASGAGEAALPRPSGTGTGTAARPADPHDPAGPRTGPSRPPAPPARTPGPAGNAPRAQGLQPPGGGVTNTRRSPAPRTPNPATLPPHPRPAAAAPRPAPKPAAPAVRKPRPATGPRPLPRSRATRLLIPYLRLDAPVMDLGLDRDRRLTAPPDDDPTLVGWYRHGASPGEQGTAVAVGHLDTDSGPAVFAGLPELKRGRIVQARRADGRIAVYTVDKIKSYEKAHFPSQEVYGARGRPELRLITCGGSYDRRKGYSGNVVVFAHLTGIR
ncbi:class F sortase [Streptomyces sp. Ag82_O1-12]|uniref:class F sortase n=1 Tax=Streptomyces sp. Ag82_O1-12 TaxID=1938854 RepID=UPI0024B80700|nr:class F sortase [Streptomyces sp. Ag82_O1-12]